MKHKVIGIDLGTTYSAVAAFDSFTQQAEIIVNRAEGDEGTTPSVVGLADSGMVMVGRSAKRNLPRDPLNTIIEIKREMGEMFRPETLAKYVRPGAAERHGAVGELQVDKPLKVEFRNRLFMPQEISAFILMKMKEIAEGEIGEEIRDAVVTVPAYFMAPQKKATEEAALLAGLYPRQLVPEPTAAAICYGVDRFDPERRVYLVYDLGGGTFDVSIIDVQEGKVEVVATSGDRRLGGGDFDDEITRWAVEQLIQKYGPQLDFRQDPAAQAKIKFEAEQAKIRLSTFDKTDLSLATLAPARAPVLELTRQTFEQLIAPYVKKSLSAVEEALRDAGKKPAYQRERISGVLLVGGSTNIPAVKQMLVGYFEREEGFVRDDLDPAAVVARGAAVLAYRFQPSSPPFDPRRPPDATLANPDATGIMGDNILITEHSLGVAALHGHQVKFDKLIERGTNIPVSKTSSYTNPAPVTELDVRVYQGESDELMEDTLVGILHLGPMTPLDAGEHKFEVTFSLDQSGILSVVVDHVNEGNKKYHGRFDQQTSVKGGVEAFPEIRRQLLALYQPGAAEPTQAQPAVQTPASGGGGATPYVPPPPPSVPPVGAEPPPAGPARAPAPEPELVELRQEAPEQFKSIVRRAQKLLLKQLDPDLLTAFNAFASALNENRPEDELVELGDELADAYGDARSRAS